MEKELFSVFDTKAAVFSNPFTSANRLTAIRDFRRACNDPNSNIFCSPEDYSLYRLATFRDASGLIEAVNPPELVATAASQIEGGCKEC